MKIFRTLLLSLLTVALLSPTVLNAQEEEKSPLFTVGADIYSNYIWRGSKPIGSVGPAFQPTVKLVTGGLTVGVWGSFDASGYAEADAYLSYAFDFGLSLGLTDYYYPGTDYFEYSSDSGTHAFELNGSYTIKSLSIGANYILNEAPFAGSAGGDMYFQLGYALKSFNVFVGAGDGWHTSDGDFAVCNIGLGTSKVIEITDKFSLPVTGQVILNPEKKQFFVVAGISF